MHALCHTRSELSERALNHRNFLHCAIQLFKAAAGAWFFGRKVSGELSRVGPMSKTLKDSRAMRFVVDRIAFASFSKNVNFDKEPIFSFVGLFYNLTNLLICARCRAPQLDQLLFRNRDGRGGGCCQDPCRGAARRDRLVPREEGQPAGLQPTTASVACYRGLLLWPAAVACCCDVLLTGRGFEPRTGSAASARPSTSCAPSC